MSIEEILPKILGDYVVGGVIFAAFMFLLKWVLKQQETILTNAKEERAQWQTIIEKVGDSLDVHTANAQEFHSNMREASKYQREEHKEQGAALVEAIVLLKRMNGNDK